MMTRMSETYGDESFAALSTEAADPRYAHIDVLSVAELATMMNEADATVPTAVRAAFDRIVPALEAVSDRVIAGGRLIYVGAGTSGRLGVLDASEVPPTFGQDPARVLGIIAGGPAAVVAAIEGAEDDRDAGAAAIDGCQVTASDAVVALASSGRTPFVIAAAERARQLGAVTVGLSCNAGAPLSSAVDFPIEVLVGAEVVSGSTRLKAGTAQKLVLNMFSTIAMVRAGKTYGNLMVDVRATNTKLRERAIHIICALTDADANAAAAALAKTDNEVKLAVVMLRLGVDAAEASRRVDAAGGRLRSVLEVVL